MLRFCDNEMHANKAQDCGANAVSTSTFYGDKGNYPKIHTNFAPGNEFQPVADARGNHVYGKQVYEVPGE